MVIAKKIDNLSINENCITENNDEPKTVQQSLFKSTNPRVKIDFLGH